MSPPKTWCWNAQKPCKHRHRPPARVSTLFISDLHLCAGRPLSNRSFFDFLRHQAAGASALYILGDLFEYWVGDDDLDDAFNASVVAALAGLAAAGVPVYLMHGNRDFVIGEAFARKRRDAAAGPEPDRFARTGHLADARRYAMHA